MQCEGESGRTVEQQALGPVDRPSPVARTSQSCAVRHPVNPAAARSMCSIAIPAGPPLSDCGDAVIGCVGVSSWAISSARALACCCGSVMTGSFLCDQVLGGRAGQPQAPPLGVGIDPDHPGVMQVQQVG